jgi:predicted Zn finger-like uncharacterized protein
MNLATRCPSCGTVFRVVQDQLRVSEGWVRCGRCNSVFNAAEVLFDIDNGAPVHIALDAGPPVPDAADTGSEPTVTDWTEPLAAPKASSDNGAALSPGAGPAGRQEPGFNADPAWSAPARADPVLGPPGSPRTAGKPHGLAQREEPLLRAPSLPASPQGSDPAAVNRSAQATGAPPAPQSAATRPPPSRPATLADATLAQPLPSFLRAADHDALWRRPAMRAVLGCAAALLTTSLLLQSALLWRDTLAARLPASEPALQALCRLTGCQVHPLRRIDTLAVDSSALNRLEGSTLYRLQLVLRNRADTAVLAPALDLSLTDAQGKLVSRRVLALADLGVAQAVLQAGQELPIKVLMATGEQRVEGYTVELFYP